MNFCKTLKKSFHFIILLIIFSTVYSCVTHKKYNFNELHSCLEMNNIYADTGRYIRECFNLKDKVPAKIYDSNIYKFDFTNDKVLNLSCLTDSGFTLIKSYKGKYDAEKNHFIVTFIKKRYFFILYNLVMNDRVKIGLDSAGYLFLNKEYDMNGFATIYASSYEYDYGCSLIPLNKMPYHPVNLNGKWGYADEHGKIILDAVYSSARLFEDSIAQVAMNGKWGIIRKDGSQITPFTYQSMHPFEKNNFCMMRNHNGLVGFVDHNGKEILAPTYDDIINFRNNIDIGISRIGSKYGIVSSTKEIIPPIFEKVREIGPYSIYGSAVQDQIATVVLGKKHYYVDKEGYMYQLRRAPFDGYWVKKKSKKHYKEVWEAYNNHEIK